MSLLTSNFKKPTTSQAVLFGIILVCCTVDMSRRLSIAGVSGLGAATLGLGGAVWAVWLSRPVLPRGLLIVLLPLMLFEVDALGTLLWYRPGMDGVQLAVIGLTFLCVLMLTARETFADPRLAPLLHRAILFTSCIPVLGCMFMVLSSRVAGDELNLTRPFALYTLPVVAVALAMWLGNNRPAGRRQLIPARALIPLAYTILIAYVVFLGMSRTALIAILIMLPLSIALRGNFASLLMAGFISLAGAGLFLVVLYSNQGLYDRFFHEDARLQVAGVAINGSGRSEIWNVLLRNIGDDWVAGKGLSASEDMVNRKFIGIRQPHNDYLRFYYDQGVIGVTIWLIFVGGFVGQAAKHLHLSIRNRSVDYPMHLAALLALGAVSFSMLTDNSVCYTFVMLPLAILMGCSLGTAAAQKQTASNPQTADTHRAGLIAPKMWYTSSPDTSVVRNSAVGF